MSRGQITYGLLSEDVGHRRAVKHSSQMQRIQLVRRARQHQLSGTLMLTWDVHSWRVRRSLRRTSGQPQVLVKALHVPNILSRMHQNLHASRVRVLVMDSYGQRSMDVEYRPVRRSLLQTSGRQPVHAQMSRVPDILNRMQQNLYAIRVQVLDMDLYGQRQMDAPHRHVRLFLRRIFGQILAHATILHVPDTAYQMRPKHHAKIVRSNMDIDGQRLTDVLLRYARRSRRHTYGQSLEHVIARHVPGIHNRMLLKLYAKRVLFHLGEIHGHQRQGVQSKLVRRFLRRKFGHHRARVVARRVPVIPNQIQVKHLVFYALPHRTDQHGLERLDATLPCVQTYNRELNIPPTEVHVHLFRATPRDYPCRRRGIRRIPEELVVIYVTHPLVYQQTQIVSSMGRGVCLRIQDICTV